MPTPGKKGGFYRTETGNSLQNCGIVFVIVSPWCIEFYQGDTVLTNKMLIILFIQNDHVILNCERLYR